MMMLSTVAMMPIRQEINVFGWRPQAAVIIVVLSKKLKYY
jgi:hypothetical protein